MICAIITAIAVILFLALVVVVLATGSHIARQEKEIEEMYKRARKVTM